MDLRNVDAWAKQEGVWANIEKAAKNAFCGQISDFAG